ncbi:hypothetical protein LCI18_010234 [Fusarium solani-melongenae]|uniref:Uncharacterized protein n=1 Tax=Fusarium solani subsp. cucurbitae TaxID=2747967 RepID=A0ACD3ZDF5_FUSSC|nr:hypothetical protein LCI18_010234 [Fusarium solani-melongenae]
MPNTENPTVFFAHDKSGPSDNTNSPIPSIEDDDIMARVVSDIVDGEGNGEAADSGTKAESSTRANSENSAGPENHGEVIDKKLEKLLKVKGKRQPSTRGQTTTVRRSSRISSVVPPKKAQPLVVKAPAKRGRGRPATKAKKTIERGGQKEWEVEKVLGSQIDADTSEQFYLVKWKGYSVKENTWEPKKNLGNCRNLIREFEEAMST